MERWETMRDKAETGSTIDQKRYQQRVKALGLRPPEARLKAKAKKDGKDDYRQDSAVNRINPDFLPDYQACVSDQNE